MTEKYDREATKAKADFWNTRARPIPRPQDGDVQWNGFSLVWNAGLNSVPLSCEPTDHEKALIMVAFERGYEDGKQAGRRILQNEFRNLMDCQK